MMQKTKLHQKAFRLLSMILVILMAYSPIGLLAAPAATTTQTETQDETIQRRIIGYFCEWRDTDIGQHYTVDKIPWGKITHINYAFAEIGTNNKIKIMDTEAAIERDYPGQDPTLPYKGHFNLLNTYKKQYPGTNTLISVGGWSASRNFYTMTDTQAGIDTFSQSCVDFIRQYGFNGVDIDYEYPSATVGSGNPLDTDLSEPRRKVLYQNYLKLMKTLRADLDAAGEQDGTHYILSIAAPASSWILGGMELGEYAQYLDYVNMMTYDFHGSWNGHVGPQSALYPDSRDTETASMAMPVLNIDWAYRYFRGVLPPEKINIGIPYYTRGWKNVTKGTLPGGLWGTAAQTGGGADGIDGIWNDPAPEQPGGANPLYHIKNLLADTSLGYQYYWDDVTKTPYVWNEAKKVFLTFEDEDSMREKCQYIIDKGLGGYLTWELSGDFDYDEGTGEYVSGDTLTTVAHNMFTAAPALTPYQGINPTEDQKANFKCTFTGNYDHPNYTYKFDILNKTGADIAGGFTLEFDFPKSAILQTPWGGTIESQQSNGDFTHYVLKMPQWSSIPNNGTYTLQGMAKLCFTGGFKNVQINGLYSKYEFPDENVTPEVHKPVITGAADLEIIVGAEFDEMDGVTAADTIDGDLTDSITVTGTVDTETVGIYELTYSVTNSENQTATVLRKITVTEQPVVKPVISGAADKEILVGDSFNAMTGVTASDPVDGDLTSAIAVSGNVDTAVAGTYQLTYSVTNSSNQTVTAQRTITVKEKPDNNVPAWDAGTTYWEGDKVSYQGHIYRAKWWTLNNIPGSEQWGPWELLQ